MNARPSLFSELRRRNVIRMAGLYLVAAWLVTQVAGTLLPMFDAPAWIARAVVIALMTLGSSLASFGTWPMGIMQFVAGFGWTAFSVRDPHQVAPISGKKVRPSHRMTIASTAGSARSPCSRSPARTGTGRRRKSAGS